MDGSTDHAVAPLLQSVACVCASHADVATLDHVARTIDACLDPTTRLSLTAAVAHGSLRLLQRVLERVLHQQPLDRFVRELWIRKAFQEAVRRGEMDMVKLLHAANPTYLAANGMELAAARGDLEMFQWLATHRPDERDGLPAALVAAAKRGHLNVLQFVGDASNADNFSTVCPSEALREAIENGHVETAEYLVSKRVRAKMASVGDEAARNGHLDMVRWLHEKNFDSAFTSQAMTGAAGAGHLEIVRFLHRHRTEGCRSRAMDGAATGGFFGVVEYLYTHRCEGCSARAVNGAAQHGHLHILQWLAEHFPPTASIWTFQAATNALAYGHYDTLAWLQDHFPSQCKVLPPYTALEVAKEGNLKGLKMLDEIHGPDVRWSPRVIEVAASNGDKEMLEWLYDHRPLDRSRFLMDRAAQYGHGEIAEWLYERGSRPAVWTMEWAAGAGHLHMLQWLHTRCAATGSHQLVDAAAGSGHLEVVQWLHENRPSDGCTTNAMDLAAVGGHLEVAAWLHENRTEGCSTNAIDRSTPLPNRWEVVQWLAHNRREGCTVFGVNDAALVGQLRMIELLEAECGVRASHEAVLNAAHRGHLNVVAWAWEQQRSGARDGFFGAEQCRQRAEQQGHFHIVEWLDRDH